MLTILRHRSFTFDVVYYDTYVSEGHVSNVPTDLTGWTVRAQIREKRSLRRGRERSVVANLNAVIPVPASGNIRIIHTREFTSSLAERPSTELLWDLVATDPDGLDWPIIPDEPVEIVTPSTNPDDATADFIPGGGGAIYHTHPISQIDGLEAALDALDLLEAGITAVSINGDDELCIIKGGVEFWTPMNRRV